MSTKITCTKIFLYFLLKECISYNHVCKNINLFEIIFIKFCNTVLVKLSYIPRTLNFTQEGQIALPPGSRSLHLLCQTLILQTFIFSIKYYLFNIFIFLVNKINVIKAQRAIC